MSHAMIGDDAACPYCTKAFVITTATIRDGVLPYCSVRCHDKGEMPHENRPTGYVTIQTMPRAAYSGQYTKGMIDQNLIPAVESDEERSMTVQQEALRLASQFIRMFLLAPARQQHFITFIIKNPEAVDNPTMSYSRATGVSSSATTNLLKRIRLRFVGIEAMFPRNKMSSETLKRVLANKMKAETPHEQRHSRQ